MNIVFESAPEGTTHFLRYASGYIVWCKIDEGQNNQLILSEWDSGNEYWVPGIFPVEHYQKIGLTSIDNLPTQNDVGPDAATPKGATHRYQHGGEISWYRETEDNLFVWRDGSWYVSTQKSAKDLAKVCPFGTVTILTQEVQLAEDGDDDLTWLARNVHEWPDTALVSVFNPQRFVLDPFEGELYFTHSQWLTRRAELQNKPSWSGAPEWAQWLAKDSPDKDENSAWWWYADKPVDMKNIWQVSTEGRAMMASSCHCDLGDWRDTLERRPVDPSEPAVTARLTEATNNVLAAAPALMDDKFSFDRGDWFERGELPPVGVECIAASGAPDANCVIVATSTDQVVVKWTENQLFDVLDMPGWSFRPIRTERELAIDEMVIVSGMRVRDGAREVMGNLYDAGYRKEPK